MDNNVALNQLARNSIQMVDQSHKDIAERIGIAVSTVEMHLIKDMQECDRYVCARNEPSRAQQARRMQAPGAGRGS